MTLRRPIISVYMTVKNGERFLTQALESIRAQNLTNWEAVIVDDGSSDQTFTLLKGLAAKDPRFKIVSTTGVGRGAALNLAVTHCEAGIITNLDSDDAAHPSRLQKLVDLFNHNHEYAAICGQSIVLHGNEHPVWRKNRDRLEPLIDITADLAQGNPVNHSASGLRKNTFLQIGGYNEKRRSQFDYDLWVRLLENGHRIGSTKHMLSAKRIHKHQSYEHSAHLRYALRAAHIQWRAVRALGSNRIRGALSICLHVLWAALPKKIRIWARKASFAKYE